MENEKDNDKIVKGTVNENEHLTDHIVDNTKILDIKLKKNLKNLSSHMLWRLT